MRRPQNPNGLYFISNLNAHHAIILFEIQIENRCVTVCRSVRLVFIQEIDLHNSCAIKKTFSKLKKQQQSIDVR